MNGELTLSRRYAKAYLNTYGNAFDLATSNRAEQAALFLKNTPEAQLVLKLSSVQIEFLQKALQAVFTYYQLPESLNALVILLIEHNRLALCAKILEQISNIYREREGISTYQIISPMALDRNALENILAFLKKHSGSAIIYNEIIDPSLIAGIRLQSDTLLWEYSIKQQLNQLQHTFTL